MTDGFGAGEHRRLLDGPFWQAIPAYREVDEAQFLDHHWQARHSITRLADLRNVLQDLAPAGFLDDVAQGLHQAPMALRVSPYILSLIDWSDPYTDPLRRQFITVGSQLLPDSPRVTLDSLFEQADAPIPGLTHRYPSKALFLALDTCPVYCRFCTRSYAVGTDTDQVEKVSLKAKDNRWEQVFRYIESHPELEDIVVSGGDAYQLKASQVLHIGERLLAMDNIRRIRYATKGPAVMPMKLLTDTEWVDALTTVVDAGRRQHKEVVLHTHFNHPREITAISQRALDLLFERGIVVRNQSVLQRGVNDSAETLQLLMKRLGYCNVQPYYVYMHDLVSGVEDLRTTVQTGIDLEKQVRGTTAGFHTPAFVVDAPGGGGKRHIHSFEHYDRETGISVYAAPSVKPGYFLYFDPVNLLGGEAQERWTEPAEQQRMIEAALEAAGASDPGRLMARQP